MTELLLPGARRDIARGLNADEARWLVDQYYQVQDFRIQSTGQARAVAQNADAGSTELVEWLGANMHTVEREIQKALEDYSSAHLPGRWAKTIVGIGPVLAAGLLAHLDITRAPTVGHFWAFAGLDPSKVWGRGEKRPWNAKLKVLCWKIGDSFVKFQHHQNDVYGHVYVERKALELERNEQGRFAEQAARKLEDKNIRDPDLKRTLEQGRLPAGQLDLRARRYAVKLFLAHLHHVMYEAHFETPPPKPYVIEHGGHTHFIGPPHWKNGQII